MEEFIRKVGERREALLREAGLGPVIGSAGNFASLPDGAKWILACAMLLGRLELFTILVLLTPRFWRA